MVNEGAADGEGTIPCVCHALNKFTHQERTELDNPTMVALSYNHSRTAKIRPRPSSHEDYVAEAGKIDIWTLPPSVSRK